MLVTCPTQSYFVNPAALRKGYTSEVVLCSKALLLKATHTDWLGIAWTLRSRLTFQRNHKRATDCNGLKPLLHLGARYYLSTTFHTITLHTAAGTTSSVSLTPLSILHVTCNSSLEDQEIGLGKCPPTMEFSPPIFQSNQFSYVPWQPATNDTTFQLHYNSVTVLPPLSFDNKTLHDLDTLYSQLDGQLTAQLRDVHHNIEKLKPATTSILNEALTYLALTIALIHSVLCIAFFCSRRRCFSPTAPPESTPMDSVHPPLQHQV